MTESKATGCDRSGGGRLLKCTCRAALRNRERRVAPTPSAQFPAAIRAEEEEKEKEEEWDVDKTAAWRQAERRLGFPPAYLWSLLVLLPVAPAGACAALRSNSGMLAPRAATSASANSPEWSEDVEEEEADESESIQKRVARVAAARGALRRSIEKLLS